MACGVQRDQKKESFWRQMMQGHGQSGLSVRTWCGRHGVQSSAFYWWRTQLARRDAEAPRFAAVHALADGAADVAGRIEIVLSGGRRVHVGGRVEPQMLAEVLAGIDLTSIKRRKRFTRATAAMHPCLARVTTISRVPMILRASFDRWRSRFWHGSGESGDEGAGSGGGKT